MFHRRISFHFDGRQLNVLLAALVLLAPLSLSPCAEGKEVEFFIVWGTRGRWDGSLEVQNGRFLTVQPYSLEPQYGDEWLGADEQRASWRSGVGGQVDGVHVIADISPDTVFHLRTAVCERPLKWSDFPQKDVDVLVPIQGKDQFLILGGGNPEDGPKLPRSIPLPALFHAPTPKDPIPLPDDYWSKDESVLVRFAAKPAGQVSARRVARNDGRLYIEIYLPDAPLTGRADVEFAGKTIAHREMKGSLWLSLKPRIGTLSIEVCYPGAETTLHAPTTLVETRGPKLYVNGEPFLVKGTLPRNLNDADAEYLKSLCANTVRARHVDYLDKYGFMGIIMTGRGPGRFCQEAENDDQFRKGLTKYLDGYEERCRSAVANPRLLIIQHANEQVMGLDSWSGRLGVCPFDRLDYLLALCYNLAKPLDPMVPHGYSNCCLAYRAPSFLDVYLHNTYLIKDRNWPPLKEFMKFQGCDRRPYVNTEFGANVYMPQAYLRGPNSPVLEKIHAWNYPHRWNTYLAAGTMGGTNYCFYDYDYSKVNVKSWDKGFTNFGVMTFDRKPKLACWELWHLWRDFEVEPEPAEDGALKLRIRYDRDYWARNCRLTIRGDAVEKTMELADFAPHSERIVEWDGPTREMFRWRMDYTTHSGLSMVACGAHPDSAEAENFLERLKTRKTFRFLRELFDAEVLTADGRRDATALKDMEREDGVVTVLFRKPNGVIYLTAFTRRADGLYLEGVDIDIACSGRVQEVNEMTGEPTGAPVEIETLPTGLCLKNLRVPCIPAAYSRRSQEPLKLPVFRITPQ